jgi:TatD DNase family protein
MNSDIDIKNKENQNRDDEQGAVYFDSHCHFDFSIFDSERERLWSECQKKNIKYLLIPGIYQEQWLQLPELSEKLSGIFFSCGLHPWWINKAIAESIDKEKDLGFSLKKLEENLTHPKCLAIGECGLDKMIEVPLDKQVNIFEQQLILACKLNMPVIIHVRKTHNEIISLLKHYQPSAGGVIHGFTGSVELAEVYWQLGFYIGIGGSITYPRANKTRDTVYKMPIESLLLETDAPDMPLNGFQGQANNPLQVISVAETLAQIKKESVEFVAKQTTQNALNLFKNEV